MAKKQADTPPKRGRPKAAEVKGPTPVAVTLRAKAEWVAWLDGVCRQLDTIGNGLDRTEAIDYALKKLAEHMKLPAPPSRL